ncbi:MAG TPA: ATP-binding protein, partial [Stellaceae bacterium]|nr:ATP-binding protein [Stellaceae bacterium]
SVEIELIADLSLEQAVAARRAGSAKLSLLTPDRADAARYALLRVRDHGPGISRQHLPRLTERFYRVEGQKSGERLGTGLGLAIVKHIVNRHRGALDIESELGEGSVFTVHLTLAPV